MLPYIAIGIAVILIALLGLVALQPSDFIVSRSTTIAAPPEDVFVHVNTMKSWEEWSPFMELDPDMKQVYEGPPAGVGASYSWSGNNKAGEGRSTIVASNPYKSIRLKLEFVRPFKGTNDVEFTFDQQGNETVVIWIMSGRNNFLGKAMSLVMDCEKMVGPMFEKGLATLKERVETAAAH